jgi:hypothetical protein
MILTWTCDLCGYLNDNNNGACRHCAGETEQRRVRGQYVTYAVRRPTIKMNGYYNPRVREDFADDRGEKQ